MASSSYLHPISPQSLKLLTKPIKPHHFSTKITLPTTFHRVSAVSTAVSGDVLPVNSPDLTDHPEGLLGSGEESELVSGGGGVVGGFDGKLRLEGVSSGGGGGGGGGNGGGGESQELDKVVDRAINGSIVLAAGAFAMTKLLTIDHDYWHCRFFNFVIEVGGSNK